MGEEKNYLSPSHHVIVEDRRHITVSGIEDVDSFDEETIIVYTPLGELSIRGRQLHINKLSIETGELSVEGEICSLMYADTEERTGGFFSKLFR